MAQALGTILHLAMPDDWAIAASEGIYTMSTRGRTLEKEGFIHCSRPDQVERVANTFYSDVDEVVVLTIDTGRVGAAIRDEPPVPGSPERYPHVYGPIPVAAVIAATPWSRSPHGWSTPPFSSR